MEPGIPALRHPSDLRCRWHRPAPLHHSTARARPPSPFTSSHRFFPRHSTTPVPPLLMSWNRKHLLDIESLTVDEITTVLDTARAFKAVGERAIKKVPALRGKTVVNLFVEPSTRTRI